MSRVVVGSNVRIEKPSLALMRDIQIQLNIYNPDFYKRENAGQSTYGVPREYQLYQIIGQDVIIPYGSVDNPQIKRHLKGLEYEIIQNEPKPIYLSQPKIKPRDYQEVAVREMLKRKRGVLVAGTGAGKTNIGLYMIRELGLRALWITHTSDLLRQSRARAREMFPNLQDGTITAGKVDVGVDITFSTIQTLVNVIDEVKDLFDVVVLDEVQHVVGSPTLRTMFYKVMNKLSAKYKYGLTATPKRNDGLEEMIFALVGQIVYTVPKEDLTDIIVPIKYAGIVNTERYAYSRYTTSAGMIEPNMLADMLCKSEYRNRLIVDFIVDKSRESEGILVLTKRVAHAIYLDELLQERGVASAVLVGKSKDKHRKEVLRSEDLQVIVATNSLAKEGLDLVRYDTLLFTYSVASKLEFIQASGRVRRTCEGKNVANVYEINDKGIEHLSSRIIKHERWAKKI